MDAAYNVYCDESCHLENDAQGVMVIGALWCPVESAAEQAFAIRQIVAKHTRNPDFEVKWTKVSPALVQLYEELIDCFFNDPNLRFRALVVPDKGRLRHDAFRQDHDTWYYKMFYYLLSVIVDHNREASYRVYLDIKDSRSARATRKLQEVLRNSIHDFDGGVIQRVQNVRSHEIAQIQMADLLIGAVAYANRGLATSSAKALLVNKVMARGGVALNRSTARKAKKLNLFVWEPSFVAPS